MVTAMEIASFEDLAAPRLVSHGDVVARKHGVTGARGEALRGFPHVIDVGLPMLRSKRASGATETVARLDTLLSIMSRLDDTCLLYRGGEGALVTAKAGAAAVESAGGSGTAIGREKLSSRPQASRVGSLLVVAEICWQQLCSLMPSNGNKKKCKRTEADRKNQDGTGRFRYPAKQVKKEPMSAWWVLAIWKFCSNQLKAKLPTCSFGRVWTAFVTLGNLYWIGSSRNTTGPSAFKLTTPGQRPASCFAWSKQWR